MTLENALEYLSRMQELVKCERLYILYAEDVDVVQSNESSTDLLAQALQSIYS